MRSNEISRTVEERASLKNRGGTFIVREKKAEEFLRNNS